MKRKRFVVLLFSICLILFAAIFLSAAYNNVGEERLPAVSVSIFGATVEPVEYNWRGAVFGGLIHRDISAENQNAAIDLGELEDASALFDMPEGFDATYELFLDGEFVSSGNMQAWQEESHSAPGNYQLLIALEKPRGTSDGYGFLAFRVYFTIPIPEPEFSTGRLALVQGEVFVVQLSNVQPDIRPTASTDLGLSIFTPRGDGEWFVVVPVGNTRSPGNYTVHVQAGTFEWEVEVSVAAYNFRTQNLIVDTSNPVITEANSPAAFQQYREKIPPLFDTYDEEIYWEGTFIRPVTGGRITTPFGAIRYTNSNWSNPRHHWGIDIAAPTGTPVYAPNHGRVVLAEFLMHTGNTIVIEHGGGLKSYYFHLDSLNVSVSDMVQKGNRIGTVGSTGFSTGPHLHFEIRIGNQAINPLMLLEDSASLYSVVRESEDL
ncbi:MAG: M23 family metallopeptidase [Clostridiales bacterium]|nr:M23 family metallopeptidase [Clostridiales bacterium]